MKNMWYNKFKSRDDVIKAMLLIIYFYYDVLKIKIGIMDNYFFCDRVSDLENVSSINSVDSIVHKIDIVTYGYDMVKNNLNVNLLMDDIIIRMGE